MLYIGLRVVQVTLEMQLTEVFQALFLPIEVQHADYQTLHAQKIVTQETKFEI